MAFLEDWASLDKDHSISLHGAIEALKASTLRLPVGGAIVRSFTILPFSFSQHTVVFNKRLPGFRLLPKKYINVNLPSYPFQADLQSMREVITSALDVMQAVCLSVRSLCGKVI